MDTIDPPDDTPAPSDIESLARKFQKELNAGLVSFILLGILDAATEDLYGYQIAKRLEGLASGSPMKQGALYPVLRALASNALLSSRVVPSYAGPARRYYRITPAGRETYARFREIWTYTRNFVDAVAPEGTASPGAPL